MRRAGAELPVPPAAIGRKHGDAILFAQPASAMIEHPAVLLARQQSAARAIERDVAANPAAFANAYWIINSLKVYQWQ